MAYDKKAVTKYRSTGKHLVHGAERRFKAKKAVFDYYGWICNCCEETLRTMLSIDHKNNDGYKDKGSNGKRKSGLQLYLTIIKQGFPDTYQVLCMSCNWSKRMNNGICEHITNKQIG